MDGVNYLAVIVGAVVYFILGGLWFSVLFGKVWLKAIGKTEEDIRAEGGAGIGYAVSMVGGVVMAYVLAVLLNNAGATTVMDGLKYGFMVWLGFSINQRNAYLYIRGPQQNTIDDLWLLYIGWLFDHRRNFGGLVIFDSYFKKAVIARSPSACSD